MPTRILIVDDHRVVRNGLRSHLSSRSDFTICGEAADGLEAVAHCKSLLPDLVLMDISMPRMGGLAASRAILQELPNTKIIIVSQNDPSVVTAQVSEIGGAGFVSKANLAYGLLPTIERVMKSQPEQTFETPPDNPSLNWIKGNGEMAARMRSTDWSRRPSVRWTSGLQPCA